MSALINTNLPGLTPHRGKVRDIYDFGDQLLLVATDRISAFDWILSDGIPDKGRLLTQLSRWWFDKLEVPNHLLDADLTDLPLPSGTDLASLEGRSMVVRRVDIVPIECVVRGYLAGSGWKEYQASQTVCGVPLPPGLVECSQLPEPIFTPATKAESGHDLNISFEEMQSRVGRELSEKLRDLSFDIYNKAAAITQEAGIILADTKFEFGQIDGELLLADEVLTPDSSRFWPIDRYQPGRNQPSFDKQFVREWLESTTWDKNSPPPQMPTEIVQKTRERYLEAYRRLTGEDFA
ncbi:phosphoribosylaminoimidazolesuccinocarboxamide synthase [Thalassoroseus pseudoceratinae]|uniref:phosphoribosylaminoimidazolesuccinocarboxamide synthase n=1 Tax=Thalassoroseus pseudoceratinae TaxID=2713176 RepID=UPI0014244F65|nr:phosphoribosylaminoimidazolesuccinocarboxamide synthase [Thalassoroseus pseudoceratinae]